MDAYWRLGGYGPEEDIPMENILEDLQSAGWHEAVQKEDAFLPSQDAYLAWERMKRGCLNYEKCATAELECFLVDKRLLSPATLATANDEGSTSKQHAMNRSEMIKVLAEADDEPTFGQLMDLPNELQSRIAELYTEDFEGPLETPCPPPLTRSNRHLRGLALPIFCNTMSFTVNYEHANGTFVPNARLRLGSGERLWLHALSPEDLACVRSLVLRFPHDGDVLHSVTITLDKSKVGFELRTELATEAYWDFLDESEKEQMEMYNEKARQVLGDEVGNVLEDVEWVEERRRFKIQDIHELKWALETALKELDDYWPFW